MGAYGPHQRGQRVGCHQLPYATERAHLAVKGGHVVHCRAVQGRSVHDTALHGRVQGDGVLGPFAVLDVDDLRPLNKVEVVDVPRGHNVTLSGPAVASHDLHAHGEGSLVGLHKLREWDGVLCLFGVERWEGPPWWQAIRAICGIDGSRRDLGVL